MKKTVITIAVLILLVAIIGFERIGKPLRFLFSDDQAGGAREDGGTASHAAPETRGSSEKESEPPRMASHSDYEISAHPIASTHLNELNHQKAVAYQRHA